MIKRLKKRKSLNRYDKFNFKFYNKVQKGFLKIANKNKKSKMSKCQKWTFLTLCHFDFLFFRGAREARPGQPAWPGETSATYTQA